MSKGLRLTEQWMQRALWLVAFVFAGFLIGLGGLVVQQLRDVEAPLTVEEFMNPAQVGKLRTEMASEQARTATLQTEAAQYAAVPAILASVDRAETALDTAMATDVEWYRYLSQMGSVTPEGVWFSSIAITAAVPGAAMASDPLAPVDSIGDVVTTGRALAYEDVATWMDNLAGVSDYDHVLVSTADLSDASCTQLLLVTPQ